MQQQPPRREGSFATCVPWWPMCLDKYILRFAHTAALSPREDVLRSDLRALRVTVQPHGRCVAAGKGGEEKTSSCGFVTDPYLLVYPLEDLVFLDGVLVHPRPLLHASNARVCAMWKPEGVATQIGASTELSRLISLFSSSSSSSSLPSHSSPSSSPLLPSQPLEPPLPSPTPVGRLDKPTTGLLLLTKDGDLTTLLCLPGNVSKTYIATVSRPLSSPPTKAQLDRLTQGIELADGFAKAEEAVLERVMPLALPTWLGGDGDQTRHEGKGLGRRKKHAKQKKKKPKRERKEQRERREGEGGAGGGDEARRGARQKGLFEIRLVIRVGRNHIVKRMLQHVGLSVWKLHRRAIGPISCILSDQGDQGDVAVDFGGSLGNTSALDTVAGADTVDATREGSKRRRVGEGTLAAENGSRLGSSNNNSSSVLRFSRKGDIQVLSTEQRCLLWEAAGGLERAREVALCSLLCRFRWTVSGQPQNTDCAEVSSKGDERLGKWLSEHYTLEGDCFAPFPFRSCKRPHVAAAEHGTGTC